MMELPATHFGLTIDPPVVPPGGKLILRYRVINRSAFPAPPAVVHFRIDPDAVEEAPEAVELGVLEPGEAREISATVSLNARVRNESRIRVQAAFVAGDALPLGSNVAVAQVRGRAVLAAAPSRLDLVPRAVGGYALEVHLTNTGDAPAEGARLTVALPRGLCWNGSGGAPGAPGIEADLPVLEPGAATMLAFPLALDGVPALPLQIIDACIALPDGRRAALLPSAPIVPTALAPVARIALERCGRRIDVRLTIDNPNVTALDDVVLDCSWPRSVRLADGSLLVDGRTPLRAGARAAIATLKTSAGGALVTLAQIAGRSSAAVCFSVFAGPGAVGEIEVRLQGAADPLRAALPREQPRAPELLLAGTPAPAVAGNEATVAAILAGGDETCTMKFACDDPALRIELDGASLADGAPVAIAAGTRRELRCLVPVDAAHPDGMLLERCIRATSDRGDRAVLALAIPVRSRAWLDAGGWFAPDASGATISVLNAGSTSAHGVRIRAADGTFVALGTIAPGERATRRIDRAAALACAAGATLERAGADAVLLPVRREPAREAATVLLAVPPDAHEGIAFDVGWTIEVPAGADTLTVRIVESAALAVVAGTTIIDGHAIVDDGGARIAAGITLRGVPPAAVVVFGTRCIARAAGHVGVTIGTTVDEITEAVTHAQVTVSARAAFPQKPGSLRFYLDADAIAASEHDSTGADEVQEAQTLRESAAPFAPESERHAALTRALQRRGEDPVADALGVLAALLPAGEAREAFAENAERLRVKLRIPGYVAEPDDYESVTARSAFDRARGEVGVGPLGSPRGSIAALAAWCATIDPGDAPDLPVRAYVRAFVRFADDGGPENRRALADARDELRSALASVPA